MTTTRASLSVVIPVFNEEPNVPALAQKLHDALSGIGREYEILLVDDGSRDETARVGRQAGAEVLEQSPNQGKGAALRAGFRYALAHGFAAVITLDADGQHDPAEIPAFLQVFSESGALVCWRRVAISSEAQ